MERQTLEEPVVLGLPLLFNLVGTVRASEHRAEGNDERGEPMAPGAS